MPLTPEQAKIPHSFKATTLWKGLITQIDDVLHMGEVDKYRKGFVVFTNWSKWHAKILPALVEIYGEFGWVLEAKSSQGMSTEYYLLLTEKPTE